MNNKFFVLMCVCLAFLWLGAAFAQSETGVGQVTQAITDAASEAQSETGVGQVTQAITDAASEAQSGILPAMVTFFGFIVTIGFSWAIVKAIRS